MGFFVFHVRKVKADIFVMEREGVWEVLIDRLNVKLIVDSSGSMMGVSQAQCCLWKCLGLSFWEKSPSTQEHVFLLWDGPVFPPSCCSRQPAAVSDFNCSPGHCLAISGYNHHQLMIWLFLSWLWLSSQQVLGNTFLT